MKPDDLQEFNLRWLAAWTARDIPDILSFYHDDLRYCDNAVPRMLAGKAQLAAYLEKNFAAMGRLHFNVDQFWSVDRGYFCHWLADVEGSEQRLRGIDLVELQDGLIVRNELFTHWIPGD